MSQMLSLIPVLLAALAAGILLPVLLRKKLKKPVAVLIGVGAFLLVTAGGMLVYLNIHYSAEPAAVQAFAESDGVTVTDRKSAVKVSLEVETPPGDRSRFFRVGFGE